MKRSWLLALLMAGSLVALNSPAFAKDDDSMDAQEDVNAAIGSLSKKVNDLESKGPSVEIHGFVQSDYISDSTQSFNETVGDGNVQIGNGKTTPAGDNGFSQFSLRNSRISLLAKESAADWTFKGYIETDFLGATNNPEYKVYTQPTLRLRHAYVQGDQNDGWQVLAGQWWTLFGWNMDYTLNTVAEPPVMATLYERIPQLRIQKTFGDATGMQLQVAISAEKPDQDISQVPTQDAGIRFLLNDIKGHYASSTGASKMMPLSLGISGRNALYVWGSGLNGSGTASDNLNNSIWASAVAGDILLPVLPAADGKDDPSIVITGEGTYGSGDVLPFNGGGFGGFAKLPSAYAGGAPTYTGAAPFTSVDNGGVVSVGGGLTPLQIQSYNGQIQIFLPPSIGTIFTGGYGEIYLSNSGSLGAAALNSATIYNDDSNWFVNVMQDVTKNTRVALEFDQFITHYTNAQTPTDNRLQLSTWYRF